MPVFVRSEYILDLYGRAREGYKPKPYAGRTILFKGTARQYESLADWESLMTGDLQVHVVHATHTELREEPHVRLWANELKAALDDCYTKTSARVSAQFTAAPRSYV